MFSYVVRKVNAASLVLAAAAAAVILSACVSATAYTENKVTVCHKGKKTLVIPQSAVSAHMGHGDTMGPCG